VTGTILQARTLLPQHQALLDARAISPEIATARGYFSVSEPKELIGRFGPSQRLDRSGLTARRRLWCHGATRPVLAITAEFVAVAVGECLMAVKRPCLHSATRSHNRVALCRLCAGAGSASRHHGRTVRQRLGHDLERHGPARSCSPSLYLAAWSSSRVRGRRKTEVFVMPASVIVRWECPVCGGPHSRDDHAEGCSEVFSPAPADAPVDDPGGARVAFRRREA
jgi:hypothetical protein